MPKPRPPCLHREINRHGQTVWYVRKGRGQRTRLRARFGTPEFMAEYSAAMFGADMPVVSQSPRQTKKPEGRSFVYFVRCGDTVKIGTTRDVQKRIAALQTSSATKLVLIKKIEGGRDVEAEMHARFTAHRLNGEWFKIAGDLAVFVSRPCTGTVDRREIVL